MTKQASGAFLSMISLDRGTGLPLYRQLDRQIRDAVLTGRLPPDSRLPSTRELARDLGISRLTAQNTYEQLIAEGYLVARVGAGTFVTGATGVAGARADGMLPAPAAPSPPDSGGPNALSARGRLLARTEAVARLGETRPFRPGVPALDAFPLRTWGRLWAKHWKRGTTMPGGGLGYGELTGHRPLREAIANYLRDARGVKCEAGQVVITAGAQHAICLAAWALLDPGDPVWVEDPGHIAGRDAFAAAGARVVPVPVDEEGLDVAAGRRRDATPRMIYVTPSRHHPLGVTMSLSRRLELLRLAHRVGAWVVEDDYDSEFRYVGRPLAAMQGLDPGQRVIYVGTFSKVLFPSLRLGYLICPPDLVDAFGAISTVVSQTVPTLPQAVLADFIESGQFHAHLRSMRSLNQERQTRLLEALRSELGSFLEVAPVEAGMHLIGWLPAPCDDRKVSAAAWAGGVDLLPLSIFCVEPPRRGALLLGFTGVPPAQIPPAARKLARAILPSPGDLDS